MRKETHKRIRIYDKNGNTKEIRESQKNNWVGKGYTLTPPKQEAKKEESK